MIAEQQSFTTAEWLVYSECVPLKVEEIPAFLKSTEGIEVGKNLYVKCVGKNSYSVKYFPAEEVPEGWTVYDPQNLEANVR